MLSPSNTLRTDEENLALALGRSHFRAALERGLQISRGWLPGCSCTRRGSPGEGCLPAVAI